jgi:hypothetical protein
MKINLPHHMSKLYQLRAKLYRNNQMSHLQKVKDLETKSQLSLLKRVKIGLRAKQKKRRKSQSIIEVNPRTAQKIKLRNRSTLTPTKLNQGERGATEKYYD